MSKVSQTSDFENEPPQDNSWLAYHWAAAGIISAAARFIPIPFLDEKVQRRCRRYVVEKTLAANAPDLTVEQLEPLYDPDRSIFLWIVRAPLKLLLFPVRKLVRIVSSIRGVPVEILNVYLLGRTLNRYLVTDSSLTAVRARDFERSFTEAFRQIDLRIARAAINDILDSVRDWKSEAKKEAHEIHQQQQSCPTPDQISHVDQSARKVSDALERPELATVLQRFDAQFDRLFHES